MTLKQLRESPPPSQGLTDGPHTTKSPWLIPGLALRSWSAVQAYLPLLKLRSVALNALSGLTGALIATSGNLPLWPVLAVAAAGGLVAAGSGAINSYLDRDIDTIMRRTSRRPLPLGRITPAKKALWAGMLLVATGLVIALAWLSWLATLFIVLGAVIYIFVYTMWLKRRTPWSVIPGGLAGSCALAAGWVAVGGALGWPLLLFGFFIFLWTPGHFWGLSIRTMEDSQRAGIPSLPGVYGKRAAAKWVALSNMTLLPLSIIPYAAGILGEVYLVIALVIGVLVLVPNAKLLLVPSGEAAWTVFKLSSPYLAVIYLAVATDILLG